MLYCIYKLLEKRWEAEGGDISANCQQAEKVSVHYTTVPHINLQISYLVIQSYICVEFTRMNIHTVQ